MHDAEPAARDPHMKVIRPGGLEAGSIPARISVHPMVRMPSCDPRTHGLRVRMPSSERSQPVTVATVPCCAVYTTRPPLHSYYSGTKPRGRYEWSGGLFLRYVRRAGLALLRDALKHAVNRTKIVRSRPTVARPRVRCRQTQHKTPPNQTRIEMRVWSGWGAYNAKKARHSTQTALEA